MTSTPTLAEELSTEHLKVSPVLDKRESHRTIFVFGVSLKSLTYPTRGPGSIDIARPFIENFYDIILHNTLILCVNSSLPRYSLIYPERLSRSNY